MSKCKNQKENGITLLALIITIILMLILATVTVNVVIDGGLFDYAGNAKDSVEIASEKEAVQKATIIAETTSKTGRVSVEEMQKAIDNIAEKNEATAMDNGDTIVVKFNESNRYYEIDNKGHIEGPKVLVQDNYAGDLSKGGACDGSEKKPFQITCIEDLVAFSIMTNGGNSELGLAKKQFLNQNVILTRTLDFKSIFSYNDYTTTIYGDLNTDGVIEDIRTELTKTDEKCIGFKGIKDFRGIFDGKENAIENIYQNTVNVALFISSNANDVPYLIKDLTLSGNITSTDWAGGICAGGAKTISNCKNYANVTGYNMVGGILDCNYNANIRIINCKNFGTINATGGGYAYTGTGGIVGCLRSGEDCSVQNCVNYGDIIGNSNCGGIVGSVTAGNGEIMNCINKGKCDSGILNLIWANGSVNILNSCNLGEVADSGIVKNIRYNEITISNCYNAGISSNAIIGKKDDTGTFNITNTYYDKTKSTSVGVATEGIEALNEEDMKNNETFIETLNNNIGTNTDWKRWKIGENGYPTFE